MSLEELDAEEFSQSLEQIGEGWFRQLALGIKLGVPEALGLTRREWSDRIGLRVRDKVERRKAGAELTAAGLSNRAIADVLGVTEGTIRNDMAAQNCAPSGAEQEAGADDAAQNSALLAEPHLIVILRRRNDFARDLIKSTYQGTFDLRAALSGLRAIYEEINAVLPAIAGAVGVREIEVLADISAALNEWYVVERQPFAAP